MFRVQRPNRALDREYRVKGGNRSEENQLHLS
jgi:hypothetical protein